MSRKKQEDPSARIVQTPDGKWSVVDDDTDTVLVTGFPSREAAEEHALDHDFYIVTGG